MAIQYSDKYVALLYKSPRLLLLKTTLHLFPAVEFWRKNQRRFLKPQTLDPAAVPECAITDALEASAPDFKANRWAFVEEIFDGEFHKYLERYWPKRRYFTAPFDRYKLYDKGFRWVNINPACDRWSDLLAEDYKTTEGPVYPAFIKEHPHLKNLIDYLRSDSFVERIMAYSGRPERLAFNRFQLTSSYPGSFVAPHRDSPQSGKNWISLLFFVAGSGGANSGGTAILGDNEFKEVIFEAKQLRNTCLIFDPSAPFYHGVRPIAFGKYRWMISAEYVSEPDPLA